PRLCRRPPLPPLPLPPWPVGTASELSCPDRRPPSLLSLRRAPFFPPFPPASCPDSRPPPVDARARARVTGPASSREDGFVVLAEPPKLTGPGCTDLCC